MVKVDTAAKSLMGKRMTIQKLTLISKGILAVSALLLASCASNGVKPSPRSQAASPHQKIGVPYRINGRLYKPAADPGYNKVGIASWYGDQFQGRLTANGEIFDKNLLSAAHTTLPMPSLVEVTNLENGRRITVRLNDRGPFVDDRIIDLSRAAATELGFQSKGLAKVRVRYLGAAPLEQLARKPGQRQPQRLAEVAQTSSPPQRDLKPSDDPIADLIDAQPDTPRVAPDRPLPVNQPVLTSSRPLVTNSTSDSDIAEDSYWISAGVFPRINDALKAETELLTIAQTEIVETAVGGTHQLRLGPFSDRFDAMTQLARIVERGYANARIIDPISFQ